MRIRLGAVTVVGATGIARHQVQSDAAMVPTAAGTTADRVRSWICGNRSHVRHTPADLRAAHTAGTTAAIAPRRVTAEGAALRAMAAVDVRMAVVVAVTIAAEAEVVDTPVAAVEAAIRVEVVAVTRVGAVDEFETLQRVEDRQQVAVNEVKTEARRACSQGTPFLLKPLRMHVGWAVWFRAVVFPSILILVCQQYVRFAQSEAPQGSFSG